MQLDNSKLIAVTPERMHQGQHDRPNQNHDQQRAEQHLRGHRARLR
jgi:hypothetical protein